MKKVTSLKINRRFVETAPGVLTVVADKMDEWPEPEGGWTVATLALKQKAQLILDELAVSTTGKPCDLHIVEIETETGNTYGFTLDVVQTYGDFVTLEQPVAEV